MAYSITNLIEDIEDYLQSGAGCYDEAASAESLLEDALAELKRLTDNR